MAGDAMHALNVLPTDQVFSHTDLDGVQRHFNTSAMVRAILSRQVVPECGVAPLPEHVVASIRANHGVEEHHLEAVDANLDSPCIMVEFEDGKSLVVDGNHRIVRRWDKGLRDVSMIVFKPGQWEQFLIKGFDDVMSASVALAIATEGHRAWAAAQK